MKLLKLITGFLMSVSLIVIFLFTAITIPTFQPGFYALIYDRYETWQEIGVSREDLMRVTRHLQAYMKGQEEDLTIRVRVQGEQREFFNQREKDHMVDVQHLFRIGFLIRRIAAAFLLTALLCLVLCGIRPWHVLAKAAVIGNLIFVAALAIFVFLVSRDFTAAFTRFHEIFFFNDLWILNPQTDLLIQIVPEPFFIAISMVVGLLFFFFLILSTIAGLLCLRFGKNKEKDNLGEI